MADRAAKPKFDVFLSYNRKDRDAVIALAEMLKGRKLKVWLDEWELRPGQTWPEALEEIIETTGAAVVLVGAEGIGPWQKKEMYGCLNEFVERGLPVIPVLLPACPTEPNLPLFLKQVTWVDLRDNQEEKGFERLMWGITGVKPPGFDNPDFPVKPADEPPPPPWVWIIGVVAVIAITAFAVQIKNYTQDMPPPKPSSASLPSKADDDLPMIKINGGDFWIGSEGNDTEAGPDETPKRRVTIKPFCMGKYEVKREQYDIFVKLANYRSDGDWRSPGFDQTDDHPVVNVSFNDAQAYLNWLNGKTGKQAYRLPTEAEWEIAARAGTSTSRYWGSDTTKALGYANFSVSECKNRVCTAPVDSFKPNEFGLHNMLGNVAEWTCSDYKARYDGAETQCGTGTKRVVVVRGGSWSDLGASVRSASREKHDLDHKDNTIGFRLAQDLNDSCQDKGARP